MGREQCPGAELCPLLGRHLQVQRHRRVMRRIIRSRDGRPCRRHWRRYLAGDRQSEWAARGSVSQLELERATRQSLGASRLTLISPSGRI